MDDDDKMRLCGEVNCEEYWIECTVCGCEFCSRCHPHSTICPECADETALAAEDDDEETVPDFDDAPNIEAIISELDAPDAGSPRL